MSEGLSRRRTRFGGQTWRSTPLRNTPPMPNGDTSQQVRDFLAYLWSEQEMASEDRAEIKAMLADLIKGQKTVSDKVKTFEKWLWRAALGIMGFFALTTLTLAGILLRLWLAQPSLALASLSQ